MERLHTSYPRNGGMWKWEGSHAAFYSHELFWPFSLFLRIFRKEKLRTWAQTAHKTMLEGCGQFDSFGKRQKLNGYLFDHTIVAPHQYIWFILSTPFLLLHWFLWCSDRKGWQISWQEPEEVPGKTGKPTETETGDLFFFQETGTQPRFQWLEVVHAREISIGRYTCRFIIGIENDKDFQVESI